MDGHYDYDMCKKCGGLCCLKMSGSYIPSDFKTEITIEFIVKLLDSGKYSVDWWEGDVLDNDLVDRSYYLRPRHIDSPSIDPSFGGICNHWKTNTGCSLPESDRPHQCRMLVPAFEIGCVAHPLSKATKKDCAIAWYEFIDKIEIAIAKHKKNQNTIFCIE